MHRTAAEIQALWQLLVLRYLYGAAQKLAYALAGVGGDGDNRHGQRILHCLDVDAAATACELVHHVEGKYHRNTEFHQLHGKIKISLNIGSIYNINDSCRLLIQ